MTQDENRDDTGSLRDEPAPGEKNPEVPGETPPAPARWEHVPARSELHPMVFAFLVLAGVFFTYQVIGGVITAFATGLSMSITDEMVPMLRVMTMASQFLLLALPAVVALQLRGRNLRSSLRLRPAAPALLLVAAVAVIALQFAMQGYLEMQTWVLDQWLIPEALKPLLEKLQDLLEEVYSTLLVMHSPGELLFVWLVIAVTPALCEELLFRGVVQSAFEESLRLRWVFILNGALFSLFHLNPLQFVPLAALGAFFSYATWRSGSIFPAMTGHLVNNTFAIVSLYLVGGDTTVDVMAQLPAVAMLAVSIGGLAVFAGCIMMYQQLTPANSRVEHSP